MRTPAGAYAGYRVLRHCPLEPGDVGVDGTGSACFGGSCGWGEKRFAAMKRVGQEMLHELGRAASGYGIGARCAPGDSMSLRLYVRSLRDVDRVLRWAGARLAKEGLGEDVVVRVQGSPVPY